MFFRNKITNTQEKEKTSDKQTKHRMRYVLISMIMVLMLAIVAFELVVLAGRDEDEQPQAVDTSYTFVDTDSHMVDPDAVPEHNRDTSIIPGGSGHKLTRYKYDELMAEGEELGDPTVSPEAQKVMKDFKALVDEYVRFLAKYDPKDPEEEKVYDDYQNKLLDMYQLFGNVSTSGTLGDMIYMLQEINPILEEWENAQRDFQERSKSR